MPTISNVVQQLETQRTLARRELEKLDLAIRALTSLHGNPVGAGARRKPKISAAGIARIRAAQKARWAKIRAAQNK
ncbi:MAG: hypothetical protein ACLPT4_05325 [Verrucomicrobiia bacterium]